jgi:hypothetical protein
LKTDAQPLVPALEITGEQVAIGTWKADLAEVIATSVELRELMHQARTEEAVELLQSRQVEEQAALVALDARPEEILSLTAMNTAGRPAYARDVVDNLPPVVLSELVAPEDARMIRFNSSLLATMSPTTLNRTIEETLDPVRYHGHRGQVSWEWLEAVASLNETNRIAELLHVIDETVLEEALVPHMDGMQMNETFSGAGASVSAFRTLSADGAGVFLPSCGDEIIDGVLRRLHDAAPDLISRIVRNAWETAGASQR